MFALFRRLLPAVKKTAKRHRHTHLARAHRAPWTQDAKDQLLSLVNTRYRDTKIPGDWDKIASYVRAIPSNALAPWTATESQNLVRYIKQEFYAKHRKLDWQQIANQFGRTVNSCHLQYYAIRGAQKDQREANADLDIQAYRTTEVKAEMKKGASWTDDEIKRLCEARGTSERFRGWARVAQYVGTGRTPLNCFHAWYRLRLKQKEQLLNPNGKQGKANLTDQWTADEIAQMDLLAQKHFPRTQDTTRTNEALALFKHKDPALVRRQLYRSIGKIKQRELNARVLDVRHRLKQMVDCGGGEADWKSISKLVGLTELRCRQVYDNMEQVKDGNRRWTRAETDRLLESLKLSKNQKKYDWYAVARAVGTRTRSQCYRKYFNMRVKQLLQ